MKNNMAIRALNQLKALSSRLRMQLLEAFSQKPVTTKQVADKLGQAPTKFYHHVDILAQAGLIRLVRTTRKRGTMEKYYQTTARSFTVDRKLFQFAPQCIAHLNGMQAVLTGMLENTVKEVRQSIENRLIEPGKKQHQVILIRSHLHATPGQIKQLNKKINKLIKVYETPGRAPGAAEYGITLVLYPVKKRAKKRKTSQDRKRRER